MIGGSIFPDVESKSSQLKGGLAICGEFNDSVWFSGCVAFPAAVVVFPMPEQRSFQLVKPDISKVRFHAESEGTNSVRVSPAFDN